ncbi:ribbon-helix-helix domain-containing protein [Nostoc sp.]|uniref:ribbon-helix-helix domain-containing protein n=1 Tax=Nostoc sp. TaxID=1180 RepID=UPI002FF577D3
MNVFLNPEIEQFIQTQIESGKYASPEEVIVDALKMFAAKSNMKAPVQVKTPEELGWPPDFFEQTAGCLQDDPLVRYPQSDYEMREPLE